MHTSWMDYDFGYNFSPYIISHQLSCHQHNSATCVFRHMPTQGTGGVFTMAEGKGGTHARLIPGNARGHRPSPLAGAATLF